MADLNQIEQALRAADAAGNKEDAARLAQAYAEARSQQAQPQAATPPQGQMGLGATAVDMARSVPGGLAKGVTGLAGIPGDAQASMPKGMTLTNIPGIPIPIPLPRGMGNSAQLPTTQQLNKTVSEPFGGYYQPKTTAGHYAETVASFAPNALLPGSLAARAARVVVPGVASEAAGQATKGKPYEPLARAGGALAGGLGEGLVEGFLAKNPIPSLEDLGKLKNATYKQAEQAGVSIAPQSFQKFATDLGNDITKNNVVSEKLHPQTMAALEAVQSEAAVGAPISLERADILRQEIGGAFEKASSSDARILTKVKNGLDKYLDDLTPEDVISGDPETAVPILKDARALAQREFKGKEIQKLIDLAENQASSNYSASGVEQALRVQFKNLNAKLIKDPSLAKSFSNEERDAIEKVARGGAIGNVLRYLGKLAPTGVVSGGAGVGLGAYGGGMIGGPVGAAIGSAAVPAFGMAARQGATAITKNNANMAAALMRAGQPLPATVDPKSAILAAILSQAVAQPAAQGSP